MYFLEIDHLHVLERGVRVEEIRDECQIELVVARDDVLRGDEAATSHLVCLLQHALGTVATVRLLGEICVDDEAKRYIFTPEYSQDGKIRV